jgi:hypothetical protein
MAVESAVKSPMPRVIFPHIRRIFIVCVKFIFPQFLIEINIIIHEEAYSNWQNNDFEGKFITFKKLLHRI